MNRALIDGKIVSIKVVEEHEHTLMVKPYGSPFIEEVHKDNCFTWNEESYTVTFTDIFLSFWGMSKDKENKVVIVCDSYSEAREVKRKLTGINGVKRLTMSKSLNRYNKDHYHISLKTKQNTPKAWWWEDEEIHVD